MKESQIIDKIEKIRARNNKNWMKLMKLSFKYAPVEAKQIMINITNCDAEINKLMKEMVREKE